MMVDQSLVDTARQSEKGEMFLYNIHFPAGMRVNAYHTDSVVSTLCSRNIGHLLLTIHRNIVLIVPSISPKITKMFTGPVNVADSSMHSMTERANSHNQMLEGSDLICFNSKEYKYVQVLAKYRNATEKFIQMSKRKRVTVSLKYDPLTNCVDTLSSDEHSLQKKGTVETDHVAKHETTCDKNIVELTKEKCVEAEFNKTVGNDETEVSLRTEEAVETTDWSPGEKYAIIGVDDEGKIDAMEKSLSNINLESIKPDSEIKDFLGTSKLNTIVVGIRKVEKQCRDIIYYLKKKQHSSVAANVVYYENSIQPYMYMRIKLPGKKMYNEVGRRKKELAYNRRKIRTVTLVDALSACPSDKIKNKVVCLHPNLKNEAINLERTTKFNRFKTSAQPDLKYKVYEDNILELTDIGDIVSLKDKCQKKNIKHSLRNITNILPVPWNRVILTYGGRKRRARRTRQERPENPSQETGERYPVQESEPGGPTNVVPSSQTSFRTGTQLAYPQGAAGFTRAQPGHVVDGGPGREPDLPLHPEYQRGNDRQASFTNWPKPELQDPSTMAVGGFFYTGRFDLVRCFHCGIGLKDWEITDTPMLEHVRNSPQCPYLLTKLGHDILESYKANLFPHRTEPALPAETTSSSSSPPTETTGDQPTPAVRSPEYSTIESRIASFQEPWPSSNVQTPSQLADAGFYYTGVGDLCRCFTCDGGLQHWDPEDDPWIEHSRWFSHCQYVTDTKGEPYVEMIKSAVAEAKPKEAQAVCSPKDSKSLTELASQIGAIKISGSRTTMEGEDYMATEAAQLVLEMGYSRDAIRIAVYTVRSEGRETYTAEDLLDVLITEEDTEDRLSDDPARAHAPDRQPPGATSADYDADGSAVRHENIRLKAILKCSVCRSRDSNILLLPCTHHVMCEQCAAGARLCPTCGKKINQKITTFMS